MSGSPGVSAKGTGSGTNTAVTSAITTEGGLGHAFLVFAESDTPHTGITDNKGNTFRGLGSGTLTNNGLVSRFYICENGDGPGGGAPAGGAGYACTFTGQTGDHSIYLIEERNIDNSGGTCVDQVTSVGRASSPFVATSATPSNADNIAYTGVADNSTTTPATHAESTGFTIDQEVTTGGPNWTGGIAHKQLSSTSAVAPSWTASGATQAGVWLVILKAASSSSFEQEGFRFYNDDGNEASATAAAAQDTNYSASTGSKLLRFLINATLDPAAAAFTLYAQKNGAGGYSKVKVGSATSPTLSWGAAGTIAYSAASGISVAPTYPAGITANSALVLVVGQKPTTANGGTVTTPSGWTLQGSLTGANDGNTGGYTTTLGADTGNCNIYVYTKDSVTGSESGTLSVTVGDNNVAWANIYRVEASDSRTLSYAIGTGKDTVGGNVSIATGSMAVAAGDFIIAGMVIPTDVTTPAQFSAEALAQTGTTFGSVVEIEEPDSTTGNDIGGFLCYAPVSSGSGSGAVTLTATAGGTSTNVRGPGFVLRIRATGVNNEVYVSTSANIASGGEATTAKLTAPSGKTTSDFVTGRRWDDENGTDTIDITSDDYTEIAWSLTLASSLSNGDYFDFRVYNGSTALGTYSVTPRWTVNVGPTGTLATTEAPDTIAISASVKIGASLATTEAADTIAISAKVKVSASLATTEAVDTFAASGTVSSGTHATLATTEAPDTVAISAAVKVAGSLATTEAADTVAISAKVKVGAALATTEASDTIAIAAKVAVHAALATTETTDTIAVAAKVKVAGSLAITEAVDTVAIAAKVLVNSALATTEATDTIAVVAKVKVSASLATTETPDSFAADADVKIVGTLATTEVADTVTVAAKVKVTGSLAVTEAPDTILINASSKTQGTLATTEAPDVFAAQVKVKVSGALAANESPDTFAAAAKVAINASVNIIEAPDTFSAHAGSTTGATLATTEAPDIVAIQAQVKVAAVASIIEPADGFAANVNVIVTAVVSIVEAPDIFQAFQTPPDLGVDYELSASWRLDRALQASSGMDRRLGAGYRSVINLPASQG